MISDWPFDRDSAFDGSTASQLGRTESESSRRDRLATREWTRKQTTANEDLTWSRDVDPDQRCAESTDFFTLDWREGRANAIKRERSNVLLPSHVLEKGATG